MAKKKREKPPGQEHWTWGDIDAGRREFHTRVAGVTFEGRQGLIRRHCRAGMGVELRREPWNLRDRNAVGVWIRRRWLLFFRRRSKLGYVQAHLAPEIADHLNRDWPSEARVREVLGGVEGLDYGVELEIVLHAPDQETP